MIKYGNVEETLNCASGLDFNSELHSRVGLLGGGHN